MTMHFITRSGLHGLGSLAIVAALAAGLAAGGASAKPEPRAAARAGTEDWKWSWTVPAGKVIEVKGVNGAIRAERAAGDQVQVRAWKRARHSDPASVKIEFVEHPGGVTVCAVYPSTSRNDPNECAPGERGHMNTRHNDVEVEFEVLVPAGVGFTGRTVNGGVEAYALAGPVEAHTVNGSIEVSTTGPAAASTVNGSITARMGSGPREDRIAFNTVNGQITLELPDSVDADVRASTVNGTIESELPLTVQGSFSRHRIEGRLGRGGPGLELETVNGSIRLRRATI